MFMPKQASRGVWCTRDDLCQVHRLLAFPFFFGWGVFFVLRILRNDPNVLPRIWKEWNRTFENVELPICSVAAWNVAYSFIATFGLGKVCPYWRAIYAFRGITYTDTSVQSSP